MGLAERRATQHYQDVQALARRVLAGYDELVAKNMKTWPENYGVSPEVFWAEVLGMIAGWLPHLERSLAYMESAKEKGEKSYHSFATGKITIDEAIEWQENRIARGIQALSSGMPE